MLRSEHTARKVYWALLLSARCFTSVYTPTTLWRGEPERFSSANEPVWPGAQDVWDRSFPRLRVLEKSKTGMKSGCWGSKGTFYTPVYGQPLQTCRSVLHPFGRSCYRSLLCLFPFNDTRRGHHPSKAARHKTGRSKAPKSICG